MTKDRRHDTVCPSWGVLHFDQGESPSAVLTQEGSRRDITKPTFGSDRHTDTLDGTAGLDEVTLFLFLNEGDFFDLANEYA